MRISFVNQFTFYRRSYVKIARISQPANTGKLFKEWNKFTALVSN